MSAPEEPVDEGWDDAGPDDAGPDDAGPVDGPADAAPATAGDAPRKRRRRRRRRKEGGEPAGEASQQQRDAQPSQHAPQPPQQQRSQQQRSQQQQQQQQRSQQQQQRSQQQQRPQQQQRSQQQRPAHEPRRDERRPRDRERERGARHRDPRESRSAVEAGGEHDLRADDDILRGDPYATRESIPREATARASQPTIDHDDDHAAEAPAVAWGSDDDAPAPPVVLAPDLPLEPPATDPDPLTYPLLDGAGAQLGDDVANVVGVRFVPAGRISWCDAGDADFAPGERVLVDSDRGQRLAWIATAATRRPVRDRSMRRVIRRANDGDLRGERDGEAERARALRVAKDVAASLRLPLKVFRVEKAGGRLNVYYTTDERLDLRDFVREVGQATGHRLELRQLGVRDEAKVVGGIGSCGLTLCCSTWLPDFVPVSIKMAKDQGLVLSPTKVSGQCGRLKCCLVYEQAGYAELRKGLPKLGKRVIAARGEGRVVEVDVLRQRVRVSYGPGDTEVLPATEVRPMFPSGNQPREPEPDDSEPDPSLPDS